jgi:hypothetical protein
MAACRLVVIGDSNSCFWEGGCFVSNSLWPQYVRELPGWPGWDVVNRAVPSMHAGSYPRLALLGSNEPAEGGWHLVRALREDLRDACAGPLRGISVRPKLVIALGTNDVARDGTSGQAVGLTVAALYDQAVRASCLDVYVATIPPRRDVDAMKVQAANLVIEARVPAERVIPFGRQPPSDLEGPAHMTEAGHRHRAALALPVLFPSR